MYPLLVSLALLVILALVLTFRYYRIPLMAWKLGFPSPKYRVKFDRNVPVPMLDGVHLFADVYRPARRGRFPVLVARTPYNKSGTAFYYKQVAELFASQGYVVVVQDVRGKNASDGKFLPYFHEALDGHSTISWAGAASWSNGNVALVGGSYLGSCAWLASQYANPYLRTIIPMFTTYDTYSIWMDHGLPYLKGPVTWLSEYSERRESREFSYGKIEPILWKLPVTELDYYAVGHPIPFYREYLTHPYPGPFWDRIGYSQHAENLKIPALIVGGWYDPFVKETIADFQRLSQSPDSELLIGPWAHNPAQEFKGISFGKKAGVSFLLNSCLNWCNRWLKQSVPVGSTKERVHYFLMGKNEWKTTLKWPPSTVPEKLYLSGKEGKLLKELPLEPYQSSYLYNPRDPALFRGTHLLYTDGWIMPIEQEEMDRSDVIVYTSDAFKESLTIAGEMKLILYVSSTARDTDFCAKISDVHPNGKIFNLSPGFLRMRYRDSLVEPKWMERDQIYRVEILFRPVAHSFLKGHRLQLQVASSDFPIHNRNLNTGLSCEETTEIREARQTLYAGREYDSHLLLPVNP